ncbi:MAG TPA: STAS domain-containing protein [Acidimicrobiia bacterium]|nr:STAS domain-containing protein [Acidimicrobiia bacterium]
MPEAKIAMSVREPAAGIKVIDINGELTAFCEPVLTGAYGEADQPGVKTVILNFEGLDYMNSGGIGLLVTMLIRAQRKNQRLSAFGLTDHYREIFSLTRLDEAISIFDSEAAAVAAA